MAKTDRLTAELLAAMRLMFVDNTPVGGTTGAVQLRAGEGIPPLDVFGQCAPLAWIQIRARQRSATFPTPTTPQAPCTAPLLVEVVLGVARCTAAFGDAHGSPPSAAQMAAEYDAQEDDADRIDRALCIAARAADDADITLSWAPGPIEVTGPEGATIAVTATATFHLT